MTIAGDNFLARLTDRTGLGMELGGLVNGVSVTQLLIGARP